MAIYETKSLAKQSFFQKIFKIFPKSDYIIELQNLLAQNENNLLLMSPQDVKNLKSKYKVKDSDFVLDREVLLDKYISACFWDNHLSDDEKIWLSHLCHLLELDDEYLSRRIQEEGELIYRNKVRYVIADNKITDSEREELNELRGELNLSDSNGRDIYSDECKKKIQSYVDMLITKRRMSPDEEKTLDDMVAGLNINARFTDDGLQKLRRFWDIENADLPVLESPVNLQKAEFLYYSAKIAWYEERTRTTYISYSGLTYTFRITKGLSLRAGNIAPSRNTEEYMKLIDSGDAYFANKRIIFVGKNGNKIIPLSKILFITPFSNGVEIGKDSGKKPFFECSDSELMGLYLARMLKDFQNV
ncbi:MAG: hypothetical protein HDR35_00510 [Treponema sp.]|nr:hypothetical protein [Treponema sp.]